MNNETYAFLDCGNQRRLERIGGILVSRLAPSATHRPGLPDNVWVRADLSFDKNTGWAGAPPNDWQVVLDGIRLDLRPAGGGQIGVFPEHARPAEQVLKFAAERFAPAHPVSALNLFAHTGLMTLRLASRPGTTVTHIDSANAAIKMAKHNAILSGLEDRPIRWLLDDVMKFCRREQQRGGKYEVIIADPPSFGRGNKGEDWKLERDLPDLLDVLCGVLTPDGILCVTCHSEGWTCDILRKTVRGAIGEQARIESEGLVLESVEGGESLRTGVAVYALRNK